jgi:hypothetical protein
MREMDFTNLKGFGVWFWNVEHYRNLETRSDDWPIEVGCGALQLAV